MSLFGDDELPPISGSTPVESRVVGLYDGVVGQERVIESLNAWASSPVHAYLFVGPPGCGKRAAARGFAATLLCPRHGCGICDVCTRVLGEVHPDLIVVEREGAYISVDQAREIIRLASRSPVEGDRKVLVLVDFHLVQNAGPTLLKIIEEPPASTHFVILAEHVPVELVTIASRCVQVVFAALSDDQIATALEAAGIEPDRAARAAGAAQGRFDRALLLATDEFVEGRLQFWRSLPRRLDGTGAAAAALAAEATAVLDTAAVGPLEARQQLEVEALEARLEASGTRGGATLRKELADRHKRELKRLRDDELRFGLGVLQHTYRAELTAADRATAKAAVEAIALIAELAEDLIRNPNVPLLLSALFLRLPHLT